jgi:hypothetical protein
VRRAPMAWAVLSTAISAGVTGVTRHDNVI